MQKIDYDDPEICDAIWSEEKIYVFIRTTYDYYHATGGISSVCYEIDNLGGNYIIPQELSNLNWETVQKFIDRNEQLEKELGDSDDSEEYEELVEV